MSDIFISYAREDRERVQPLVRALEELGWSVWWDRSIRAGKTWDSVIEQAIDSARCVVVVWSHVSVGSDWVRVEADEGRQRGILVPVLLDDVKMPLAFRRLQAASLIRWSGVPDDPLFLALREAVADVLGVTGFEAEARSRAKEYTSERERPVRDSRKATEKRAAAKAAARPALRSAQPARVLNLGRDREPLTLRGHGNSVQCVAWSPDGRRLATGSEDGTAKVWAPSTGRELLTLHAQSGVKSVAWNWNPDEIFLATAGNDDRVTFWDAVTGEIDADDVGDGHLLTWRPGGHWLAMFGQKEGIWVRDITTGERLPIRYNHPVASLAWSPDGARLAAGTGNTDGQVNVWDADSGKQLMSLSGHDGGIYGVSWSPDGSRIATTSDDGTLRVWDARSGELLRTLSPASEAGRTEVWTVSWRPDGKGLATGSQDGVARLWDADSGRQLLNLHEHAGAVKSVAWSPNGKQLATASEDKTAMVWEVGT